MVAGLPGRLRGLGRVVVLVVVVASVMVASWPAGAAPSGAVRPGIGGGCACASTSGGSPLQGAQRDRGYSVAGGLEGWN